jgi:hypothetical protein
MQMVRQNADGVGFERTACLDDLIDAAEAVDLANQQVAGAVSKHDREEKRASFNFGAAISRHDPCLAGER